MSVNASLRVYRHSIIPFMSSATQRIVFSLPHALRPSLPWPRCDLRTLELPSVAKVPDGALQKGAADRGLLMSFETSLAEQVDSLSSLASLISVQLDAPREDAAYLQACFDRGLLLKEYNRFVRMHPADLAGHAVAVDAVRVEQVRAEGCERRRQRQGGHLTFSIDSVDFQWTFSGSTFIHKLL